VAEAYLYADPHRAATQILSLLAGRWCRRRWFMGADPYEGDGRGAAFRHRPCNTIRPAIL